MIDPLAPTSQAREGLSTSPKAAAPAVAWQALEPKGAQEPAAVDHRAIEEQIALATLLLMNQELSRSRLQLEQRLREAQQEEV